MTLFANPAQHAANPPHTWQVVKAGTHQWTHATADGTAIGNRYDRKSDAENDLLTSPYAKLWTQEQRWYAGESVPGWRPYAECLADRVRNLLGQNPDRSWTPSEVGRRLKIDTTAAGNVLRPLAADGKINADGNGAWTRYSHRQKL
uniref:hypothetical protein n=1 Tax=Nonomuraea sp. CA-251285 TaxID=3240002 RepID=UPI003F497083